MNIEKVGMTADVSAKINLNPQRNQIAIFTCLTGSIFFALITCLFLWFEKSGFLYPLTIFAFFALAGVYFFQVTYRGGALADSAPFEVKKDAGGTYVKMHPSLFTRDKDFANVLTLMACTKHLPSASGMINERGDVIPNSKGEAEKVVKAANASVEPILRSNLENINKNTISTPQEEFIEEPGNTFISALGQEVTKKCFQNEKPEH